MRVVVIDDEAPARRKIIRLLAEDTSIEVIGEAGTGPDAVTLIEDKRPDIVFLDVQMPEFDGFSVLREIEVEPRPAVVFVTAYDEYAVKAFEEHACDYLLKPFEPTRFFAALDRAKQRVHTPQPHAALLSTHYPARLLIRDRDRATLLAVADIDWAEGARNYVSIHCAGKEHLARTTLQSFEAKLDPKDFARISKSHIVRMASVVELQPWSHGEYKVRLKDGAVLTWTRRFLNNLPTSP